METTLSDELNEETWLNIMDTTPNSDPLPFDLSSALELPFDDLSQQLNQQTPTRQLWPSEYQIQRQDDSPKNDVPNSADESKAIKSVTSEDLVAAVLELHNK